MAIIYTPKGLSIIVCNSANLKQKESSIHRKASAWKETLNTKIRVELANFARQDNISGSYLEKLKALKASGFITDEEFETLRKRIKK